MGVGKKIKRKENKLMAKTQAATKKVTQTQKSEGKEVNSDVFSYEKALNVILERLEVINENFEELKRLVKEDKEITVNLDEDNFTKMIFEYLNSNDKFRENIINLYSDIESNYMKMGFNKQDNKSNLYIEPKLFMSEMKKYFPFIKAISKI